MNRVPTTTGRRPRVYTIRATWLWALLTLLATGASAQPPADISIDPAMVKGSDTAAVTIVEFSDYQ